MNVIFLTLSNIKSIGQRNIYTDLMRKFRDEGHRVCIVAPSERREGQLTQLAEVDGVQILRVQTLNIQKTNVVEKGLGTLFIEGQFRRAIRKHFADVRFDLILYSTPPITFTNVVRYLKRQSPGAVSYLLLKDIFPQNAVDIGMFSRRSPFWWFFRKKEVRLYRASDYIGCMSPANVDFVCRHNPYYPVERVEVAPNSIEVNGEEMPAKGEERDEIRAQYGLPTDKPVFIYGGNLGRPQGISFLIGCLEANKHRTDCHFAIVGNGTEYHRLERWHAENQGGCITLMRHLPKEEYDRLVGACDVGLIFLDHRFTIPNYPSRLLSYLENRMPVLCATDPNTDIGSIAQEAGYGLWCESQHTEDFTALVDRLIAHPEAIPEMGKRGYQYLLDHYQTHHTYLTITQHVA